MYRSQIGETQNLESLSPHLFWDVDKTKINWQKDDLFIIERVLEYGLWQDWETIKTMYGTDYLAEKVVHLRSLDNVTLSFLCLIFNLEPQDFRCYRLRQSGQSFWG